jgi:hypothetical protein
LMIYSITSLQASRCCLIALLLRIFILSHLNLHPFSSWRSARRKARRVMPRISSSTFHHNRRLFIQQGLFFRGIFLRKTDWGCRRMAVFSFCTFGRRQERSKQKLPHQLFCWKWGKGKGCPLPQLDSPKTMDLERLT